MARQDYYNATSSAYAIETEYEIGHIESQKRRRRVRTERAKPARPRRKHNQEVIKDVMSGQGGSVFSYLMMGCVFVGVIVFVFSLAVVSQRKFLLTQARSELKKVNNEISEMKADIYNKYDIGKIELAATTRLEMIKPEEYQKIYFSIPARNYVKTFEYAEAPERTGFDLFAMFKLFM